ncbi:MAG: hypothetical protein ACI9BD_000409 [Candidatus Marinamargulisbacteria bacterium]|jgi:hypothetical protein
MPRNLFALAIVLLLNGLSYTTLATNSFDPQITYIIEQIHEGESAKDATCWSTVRQMESFYARKPLTEQATLLKIEASKLLLLRFWQKASSKSKKSQLTRADIAEALPKGLDFDQEKSIQQSVAQTDYHKVTENWRLLLSILMEKNLGEGIFKTQTPALKPLSKGAATLLSEAATALTISLLAEAKDASDKAAHLKIEPDDIKSGFKALSKKYGQPDASEPKSTIEKGSLAEMLDISRQNIRHKIDSLRAWNHKVWTLKGESLIIHNLLNKISPVPLTEEGYAYFIEELTILAKFAGSGFRNKRIDIWQHYRTFFEQPPFPGKKKIRQRYISLTELANNLEDAFPVTLEQNADVSLRLVYPPHRKRLKRTVRDKKIVLKNFNMDAIRDTTVHWYVMQIVWEKENVRPIGPFAAELLSERISILAWYLLKEASLLAEKQNKNEIDVTILSQVAQSPYLWAKKEEAVAWPYQEKKPALFNGYRKRFFKNVTKRSGIDRTLYIEVPENISQHEAIGSGIAVADLNQDSLPDIFLAGIAGNKLYLNEGNFKFKDVTEEKQISDTQYKDTRHALFADANNDGKIDLLLVHADSPTRLFIQTNQGKFEDRSQKSGIKTQTFATCATFFDFNNDGLLDLFIGHHGPDITKHWRLDAIRKKHKSRAFPESLYKQVGRFLSFEEPYVALNGKNGMPNQLYMNLGNGTFKDVSKESGIDSTSWTLASAAIDYNHDGWIDLHVANDFGHDELFINQKNGTFKEVGQETGIDDRGGGMNVALTDYNHDGFMDSYVTVIDMFSKSISFQLPTPEKTFHLDDYILKSSFYLSGNKFFLNRKGSGSSAIENLIFEPGDRGWGWGAVFFDYENDGDEDLYITNGFYSGSVSGSQKNQLFIHHNKRFYLAPFRSPESFKGNSRSVAAVDLNNSGKTDLIVSDFDASPQILRNTATNTNNWFKVALQGTTNNRFGIGARVRIKTGSLPTLTKIVSCGSQFLSQEDTTLTFGIGTHIEIEEITVIWPGNKRQIIKGPFPANQRLVITES